MSHRFDASSKYFLALSPRDWLALIGADAGAEITEIDSDVSTVSARADKLLLVAGDIPRIEHIEIQAARDSDLPVRVCWYGVLLHYKRRLTIHSTVVLLRPSADCAELTGLYEARLADGTPFLQYRYQVIRIWELPPEIFLSSGIGVLALAPLGKIKEDQIPELIDKIRVRVDRELDAAERANFWTGLGMLLGLKFSLTRAEKILEGIGDLKESIFTHSVVAQMLINKGLEKGREEGREEGRAQEARKFLLRILARRFASVAAELRSAVESIAEVESLERLIEIAIDESDVEVLLEAVRNEKRPDAAI
jgi:predicted transposase YdaD